MYRIRFVLKLEILYFNTHSGVFSFDMFTSRSRLFNIRRAASIVSFLVFVVPNTTPVTNVFTLRSRFGRTERNSLFVGIVPKNCFTKVLYLSEVENTPAILNASSSSSFSDLLMLLTRSIKSFNAFLRIVIVLRI